MESNQERSRSASEQLHEFDRAESLAIEAGYPETLWWQPLLLAFGAPIIVAVERIEWFTGVIGGTLAILGVAVLALSDIRRRKQVHGKRLRLRGSSYQKTAGTMFVALIVISSLGNLAESTNLSTWLLAVGGFGASWLAWSVLMRVARTEFVATSRAS